MRAAAFLILLATLLPAAEPTGGGWVNLLNGKDLEGWEVIGDGIWTVMRDGTLLGQRDLRTADNQSWLYTKKEYGQFDLYLEWWTRRGGNSGVSIRDSSRAKYAVTGNWDANRTPSHIGYEIQISNGYKDYYPSGSVYLFDQAKQGFQIKDDWNAMEIKSRNERIQVLLNGHLVSEHPGDPQRLKVGPIGLQLHDKTTVAMFRHIKIREIRGK